MACPYLNYQWVTQGEIFGFRIFHSFEAFPQVRAAGRTANSMLRNQRHNPDFPLSFQLLTVDCQPLTEVVTGCGPATAGGFMTRGIG